MFLTVALTMGMPMPEKVATSIQACACGGLTSCLGCASAAAARPNALGASASKRPSFMVSTFPQGDGRGHLPATGTPA